MNDMTFNETWVLSPDEFEAAFNNMPRGDVLVYCVGDLAYSRATLTRGKEWANLQLTASMAYDKWKRGDASHLWQKKLGPSHYEYRIIK